MRIRLLVVASLLISQIAWNPTADASWCGDYFLALKGKARALFVAPPAPVSDAEYDLVADTPVSQYFPSGELTAKGQASFFADMEVIFATYEHRHGVTMPGLAAERARWNLVREDLMRAGFATTFKNKTLEQIVMERHRLETKSTEETPLFWKLARPETALLPFRATWGMLKYFGRGVRDGTKLQFGMVLFGGVIALFVQPIANTISRSVNEYFGGVAVKEQQMLAALDSRISNNAKHISEIQTQLDVSYERYKRGEISRAEFDRLWQEAIEICLQYKYAIDSTLPDNIRLARFYYTDGAIQFPLIFLSSAASVHTEILQYQAAIREFETALADADRGTRPLSPSNREVIATELAEHRQALVVARQRMATVLAMHKVYEILHPEYNRSDFLLKHRQEASLLNSHEQFLKGLAFDEYYQAYSTEVRKALADVGVYLTPATK